MSILDIWKTATLPATAAMLACGLSIGCSRDDSQRTSAAAKPPRIEVTQAATHVLETVRSWPGTMEPLRIHEIVAPEDGRVVAMHFDAGDPVAAGELVAEVRFPEIHARSAELVERVGHLEAEKKRRLSLAERRATSDAEVAAARIELLQAKAELSGIQALLDEGELKSPASGIVLEKSTEAGSAVVQGAVLARIADASSMGVRLKVPNTEIAYFDSSEALSATDARGGPHSIARIVRHGEVSSNTTGIELWFDTASATTGAVKIEYRASREALCIPWSAVATDDERAWVALLDGENKIQRRTIKPGETSGTLVEVIEGLAGGDVVVRYQPRSHGEGATIEPVGLESNPPSDE